MVRRGSRDEWDLREAYLLALGGGVFVVWMVTQLASVFFNRPVDAAVHGIMFAVVTGSFTGAFFAGRKSSSGESSDA